MLVHVNRLSQDVAKIEVTISRLTVTELQLHCG